MLLEFLHLSEIIREKAQNKPVVYCPNFGNWGDGLIHQATLMFFRHFAISYVVRDRFKLAEDTALIPEGSKLLIFGGAGSWRQLNGKQSQLLPKCAKTFEHAIVLPASYGANFNAHFAALRPDEFPLESQKVTFFARDNLSSLKNNPGSFFCHDMAFFVGNIDAGKGAGIGNFFRKDAESTGKILIPKENLDISDEGRVFTPISGFFKAISTYETIRTDRLHVCIAASLMDRNVEFYSGAYFKNYDLYRSSLAGRFKKVEFKSV